MKEEVGGRVRAFKPKKRGAFETIGLAWG